MITIHDRKVRAMNVETLTTDVTHRRGVTRHFVRHYVEMVICNGCRDGSARSCRIDGLRPSRALQPSSFCRIACIPYDHVRDRRNVAVDASSRSRLGVHRGDGRRDVCSAARAHSPVLGVAAVGGNFVGCNACPDASVDACRDADAALRVLPRPSAARPAPSKAWNVYGSHALTTPMSWDLQPLPSVEAAGSVQTIPAVPAERWLTRTGAGPAD
jgi:hypothetical protein